MTKTIEQPASLYITGDIVRATATLKTKEGEAKAPEADVIVDILIPEWDPKTKKYYYHTSRFNPIAEENIQYIVVHSERRNRQEQLEIERQRLVEIKAQTTFMRNISEALRVISENLVKSKSRAKK